MPTYNAGRWLAICDRCGFKFKSDELKKDWQGLMVCSKDFELRHPQDLIKIRADHSAVPWSRPEGEDVFLQTCFLWTESAYAGLGTAGCMKAGYTPMSYADLLTLRGP